jgi:hypothetical protein
MRAPILLLFRRLPFSVPYSYSSVSCCSRRKDGTEKIYLLLALAVRASNAEPKPINASEAGSGTWLGGVGCSPLSWDGRSRSAGGKVTGPGCCPPPGLNCVVGGGISVSTKSAPAPQAPHPLGAGV